MNPYFLERLLLKTVAEPFQIPGESPRFVHNAKSNQRLRKRLLAGFELFDN